MGIILEHIESILVGDDISVYDLDDIDVRDHRERVEVHVRTPKQFLTVARGLEVLGWRATEQREPQRLLIGVTFDSAPEVAVLVSIRNLSEWSWAARETSAPAFRKPCSRSVLSTAWCRAGAAVVEAASP